MSIPEPRRTFAPVVLLGLASGAVAAVAATKAWVRVSNDEQSLGVVSMTMGAVTSAPLSTALALVVLACWGVILVTRGRFRWAVSVLAAVAALGNLVTVALAPGSMRSRLDEELLIQTGEKLDSAQVTVWFWIAVPAAVLVVLTTALAVRWVRAWPEMGTKYDSPTAVAASPEAPAETNIDIWKALDEGKDPTA